MATLTQKSVIDTLELTDGASVAVSLRLSASDAIVLAHSASTNFKLERITSALSLVDVLRTNVIDLKILIDDLFITDYVQVVKPVSLSSSSALNLTQVLVTNMHGREAETLIELSQSVVNAVPKDLSAVSYLAAIGDLTEVDIGDPDALAAAVSDNGLRDIVSLNTVLNISVRSYISLAQQAAKAEFLSVEHVIPLTQEARVVEWEIVESVLTVAHAVVVHNCTPAESELEVTQLAEANGVRLRGISSALTVTDTVSAFIVNLDTYGLIADQDSPIDVTEPTLLQSDAFTLYYPSTSPTMTLSLPNPEWDNYIQIEQRRIVRRTRGGSLKVSRDDAWPSAQRMKFDFTGLTDVQRNEWLRFAKASVGKLVKIVDHESREWIGLILTPTSPVQSASKVSHSLTFEFEQVVV